MWFNKAISLAKDVKIDKALEIFMVIREDLEGMVYSPQPDSDLDADEEDSSYSDGDHLFFSFLQRNFSP